MSLINRQIFSLWGVMILLILVGCPATVPQHKGCYVADSDLRGTYTGECKNDKAHGFGKAVGKDTYEGEFVEGVINGTGTYLWSNGNRYVGKFQNGERHGLGTKIYKDGRRVAEEWEKGKKIR